MIKIAIVEQHEILKEGLKGLLKDEENVKIVAEFQNEEEAFESISLIEVDVILMDADSIEINNLHTIKRVCEGFKTAKILLFSMIMTKGFLLKCFNSGAHGYILKNINKEELIFAIKKVMNGDPYIPSEIGYKILEKFKEDGEDHYEIHSHNKVELSEREFQVLRFIAEASPTRKLLTKYL